MNNNDDTYQFAIENKINKFYEDEFGHLFGYNSDRPDELIQLLFNQEYLKLEN